MSSSRNNFLNILPLFAILSISPLELQTKVAHRGIASAEVESSSPKYDARALKVDRKILLTDKDFSLAKFTLKSEGLRSRMEKERSEYKVEITEPSAVEAQKKRIQTLVQSLVDLEENTKILKEKKTMAKSSELIVDKSMEELRLSMEGLLRWEIENDLAILTEKYKKDEEEKSKKEETAETEPEADKPKAEETTVAKEPETKPSYDNKLLCELEDKNAALTKQVQDLIAQQKTITDSLAGMQSLLAQMNQRQMYQQYQYQSPVLSNYSQIYPTVPAAPAGGTWIYYPQALAAAPQMQYQQPIYQPAPQPLQPTYQAPQDQQQQLGQHAYNQNTQSGQYQYYQQQPTQYDLRYTQPQPTIPGEFIRSPFSYNFETNSAPVQFT